MGMGCLGNLTVDVTKAAMHVGCWYVMCLCEARLSKPATLHMLVLFASFFYVACSDSFPGQDIVRDLFSFNDLVRDSDREVWVRHGLELQLRRLRRLRMDHPHAPP